MISVSCARKTNMKRRLKTPHAPLLHRAKRRPSRHAALKGRVRAAQPLHIRFALHPLTVFMLMLTGVIIAGWTVYAGAASYTVNAKVPAPPLTEGAVITSPADGTVTAANSIVVSGTCPSDSYITLSRNNLFSGVSVCDADNTFTISTALSPGETRSWLKITILPTTPVRPPRVLPSAITRRSRRQAAVPAQRLHPAAPQLHHHRRC